MCRVLLAPTRFSSRLLSARLLSHGIVIGHAQRLHTCAVTHASSRKRQNEAKDGRAPNPRGHEPAHHSGHAVVMPRGRRRLQILHVLATHSKSASRGNSTHLRPPTHTLHAREPSLCRAGPASSITCPTLTSTRSDRSADSMALEEHGGTTHRIAAEAARHSSDRRPSCLQQTEPPSVVTHSFKFTPAPQRPFQNGRGQIRPGAEQSIGAWHHNTDPACTACTAAPCTYPSSLREPWCFLSHHVGLTASIVDFSFFFHSRMKATTALLARANQLIAFRHGRLNAGACEIPLYDSDLLAHRAPARPAPRARARRTMRPVAARDAERCALSPREAPSGAYQIGLTGCLDAGMCVCERACARLCDAEER